MGIKNYIVLIIINCFQAFPVIHVFMESRTKSLYDTVFAYIQQHFPNFLNGNIVTDYEVALVESLRNTYPNTMLHGCFFHYCQVINYFYIP